MSKRILFYFFLSGLVAFSLTFWALFATEPGLRFSLAHFAESWKRDFQIEVEFGAFTTPEFGSIKFDKIEGYLLNTRTKFSLTNTDLSFVPTNLIIDRNLVGDIQAEKLVFFGRFPVEWLHRIPLPPQFGCMLPGKNQSAFESLYLKKIRWIPDETSSFSVSLRELVIGRNENSQMPQPLSCEVSSLFFETEIFTASMSGEISFPNPGVEAHLVGKILGLPIDVEVQFISNPESLRVAGTIRKFSIDFGYLFKWLWPLFDSNPPMLALKGKGDVSGLCTFDSTWGLGGNLTGKLENLGVWFIGLPFPLIETNCELKFSQNQLQFIDRGSTFGGFPAQITGKIGMNLKDPPSWDLSFSVPLFSFETLLTKIPWAIKYSLQPPEVSGNASFSFFLQGQGLVPLARFSSILDNLVIRNKDLEFQWTGRVDGWKTPNQKVNWRMPFSYNWISGQVPFSQRLELKENSIKSINGTYEGKGLEDIILKMEIKTDSETLSFSGIWKDKTFVEWALSPKSQFDLHGLSPVSLLFPLQPLPD